MIRETITTLIASCPSQSLVITFSTLLLLLLSVIVFFSFASTTIDKDTIFTNLLRQAWAFEPTNTTTTQQSPNGTTNLTPSPVEFVAYTDKPSYVVGEVVLVGGSISNATQGGASGGPASGGDGGPLEGIFGGGGGGGKNVRIDIYNPRGGVLVSNLQAPIDDTGLYSYSVYTSSYSDVVAGEYTATATYNRQAVQVKFSIVPSITG